MSEEERINLALNMSEGGSVNYSDAKELAERLGLPEALIAAEPVRARRLLYESRLRQNRKLLDLAESDGIGAAIARDNHTEIDAMARALDRSGLASEGKRLWENLPQSVKDAWENARPDNDPQAEGQTDRADPQADGQTDRADGPYTGRNVGQGSHPEQAGGRYITSSMDYFLDPFRNFANGWLDILRNVAGSGQAVGELTGMSGVARWFGNWAKMIKSAEFETARPEGFGAQLAQDVVRNTPQVAAQIAIALGSYGASAGFMFDQIFGGDYLKHRERGITPENAAFAGAVDAALQSVLERMGLKYMMGGGGMLGKYLGKLPGMEAVAGKVAASPVLSAAGRGAIGEAVTETAQHMPEYLTDFWAESSRYSWKLSDRARWTFMQATDLGNFMQGTRDALYEGLVGGILGGGAGAIHGYGAKRWRLRQEERDLAEMERRLAVEAVERLNFQEGLTRARETLQGSAQAGDFAGATAMAAAALPDGSRHAWISPEDLTRILTGRPELIAEILRAMDMPQAAFQSAAALGMDIEIDLAPVLATQGDAGSLLLEAARMRPDSMSGVEAALWSPDSRLREDYNIFNQDEEELGNFGERELARDESVQLAEARSRRAKMNRHLNRLASEMRAQGLTELEARGHIEMIESHALAFWKSYGMDPVAWLAGMKFIGEGENPDVFGEQAPGPDLPPPVDPDYFDPGSAPDPVPENAENRPDAVDENTGNPEQDFADGTLDYDILPGETLEEAAARLGVSPETLEFRLELEGALDGEMAAPDYPADADLADFDSSPDAFLAEDAEAVPRYYDTAPSPFEDRPDSFLAENYADTPGAAPEISPDGVLPENRQATEQASEQSPEQTPEQAANQAEDFETEIPETAENARPDWDIFNQEEMEEAWTAAELDPGTLLNSGHPRNPRGQALISASQRIIRLFRSRNVATVPHELSHIFMDDLMRIAASDGDVAIRTLLTELSQRPGASELVEDARRIIENAPDKAEALRQWAAERGAEGRRIREEREKAAERLAAMKEAGTHVDDGGIASAEYAALESQALALNDALSLQAFASRLAKRAARHIDALETAREDLDNLARFGNVTASQLARLLAKIDAKVEGEDRANLSRMQEKGARAFESWVMDGKAPSRRLTACFARMAAWLRRLYENAASLVRPSPEVAEVFARLLATRQEIEDMDGAAFENGENAFLDDPILSREDRKRLRELLAEAETRMGGSLAKQLARRRERYRRERERALYKKLAHDPFWKLVEHTRFSREEIEGELGDRAAAELIAAYPRILQGRKQRTESLGELVEAASYESASAMFADIHDRLAKQGLTRKLVAERMTAEELAEMEKEDEAATNRAPEALGKYLTAAEAALLRHLAKLSGQNQELAERMAARHAMSAESVRFHAETLVREMPVRQLTAARFQRMITRNLKERNSLLQSGRAEDLLKAMDRLNSARVALAAYEMLLGARQKVRKFINQTRDIRSLPAGKIGVLQTEALRKLFAGFSLGELSATEDGVVAASRSLAEMVTDIAGDGGVSGYLPPFAPWLLNLVHPQTGRPGPIRHEDLSIAELEELQNLTAWLLKSGEDENIRNRAAEKAWIQKIAGECAAAMNNLPEHARRRPGTLRDSIAGVLERAGADTDRLLFEARKADGLVNLMGEGKAGPMEQLIHRVEQAEENVKSWLKKAHEALAPHLAQLERCRTRLEKTYGKNLNIMVNGKALLPPERWRNAYRSDRYTVEMLIAMACHMGNSSNAQRLVDGYNDPANNGFVQDLAVLLGSELVSQATNINVFEYHKGLLNSEDLMAIQGIWDALEIFWPDTVSQHRRMFGFAPPRVVPRPLCFRAADGQVVRLRGGYFPIRYDGNLSDRIGKYAEDDELLSRNISLFNTPAARRGHTRARTKKSQGHPVKLDLSMLGEHVSDAARFIEYGTLVRRLDRVTRETSFRQAYERAYGRDDYNAIRDNLRGLVRTEAATESWAQLIEKVRPYMVYWGIAWNLNTALMQLTAVFPAMADIGPKNVLSGLAWLATHGIDGARQIWKASPYMLSRLGNLDQDLQRKMRNFSDRQASIRIGSREFSWQKLVDFGMQMIVGMDAIATCSVWLGAYNAKLKELRRTGLTNPLMAEDIGPQPVSPLEGKTSENARNDAENAQNSPENAQNGPENAENGQNGSPAPGGPDSAQNGQAGSGSRISLNPLAIFRPAANALMDGGGRPIQEQDPFHYEAVRHADMIVRQSNPDYDAPSRSRFLRGKGINSLVNQFASATTLFASRARFLRTARKKGRRTYKDNARENFFAYILPSLAIMAGRALMQGWGGDGDDPADIWSLGSRVFIDQFAMQLPGAFSAIAQSAAYAALPGEGTFNRGGIRTVLDTPVQLLTAGVKAASLPLKDGPVTERDAHDAIYAAADLLSFYLKTPISRIVKRAERGHEQMEQGKGTPMSMVLPR